MSSRLRRALRHVLFRYGWDTRGRHLAAARLLREATAGQAAGSGPALLDVGCGREGMAAFLRDVEVVGVDVEPPGTALPNRSFTRASIEELPFADRAFACVACIDVLQELPADVRERGISELMRVGRDRVVIAAPHGEVAQRMDADFDRALRSRGSAVPPWATTALANPYPTVEEITAAISRADPNAEISVSYHEPARVSRFVRAAAIRSSVLYAAANLLCGALSRALRAPASDDAYRMLIVARPGAGSARSSR